MIDRPPNICCRQPVWLEVFGAVVQKNAKYLTGIYVNYAFLVSDNEIRIIYFEYQHQRQPILAYLNSTWKKFEWFCINYSTCSDYGYCSMAPRIGRLQNLTTMHFQKQNEIQVTTELSNEFFKIPLIDVREKSVDDKLGVCLQPLFFLTDWTILIQFFESWLAQGATKFYIYLHSYTKKIDEVLKFYKSKLDKKLELIDWSDLPIARIDKGNYRKDPNAHVFRYGATAFMHDCMLRARFNVKFIANTDLDDLPVTTTSNSSFAEALDNLTNRHPFAGQFVFDWILSKQNEKWDEFNSPSDVRFYLNETRIFDQSAVRFDYKITKKIVHRPERVIHFDQHNVYGNEKMKNGRYFTAVELFNNSNIYFLHLRRFERSVKSETEVKQFKENYDNSALIELERKMMENYEKRLGNSSFKNFRMSPWQLESRETMRNLEQCRLEGFGQLLTDDNQMCRQSSAGCAGLISTNVDFILAPITWLNIAHRARFNTYIH